MGYREDLAFIGQNADTDLRLAREAREKAEADLDTANGQILTLQARIETLEAALQPPPPPAPEFLFADDFYQLPKEGIGQYHLDAPEGAFSVPTDPIDGKPALRILLRRDQPLRWNAARTSGRCKSELGYRGSQTSESYARFPRGATYYFRRDYLIPNTWKRSSYKFPIWGLHAPPAPRAPLSVNLVGGEAGNNVRCFLWHGTGEAWTEPLLFNKWYSFVFKVRFNVDGYALTDFYVNSVLKYTSTKSNIYGDYLNTSQGGLYCPSWSYPENQEAPNDGITQQTIYMRRLLIGTDANTLEEILA